jgi:hypothetical protein
MAGPTTEQREAFAQLVSQGIDPRDALNRVMVKPAGDAQWRAQHRYIKPGAGAPEGEVLPDVGAAEALGRGAAQGATLRFGDEVQGLIQAVGNKLTGYHDHEANPPTMAEDYARERDAARTDNERAQKAHGGAYLAGEIGGGIATSPAMGGANTLKQAVGLGGKIGAAAGLGGSSADLTRGGSVGEAAADTALGGAFGMGAGAAGYGIAKAVGATGRWVLDKLGARSRVPDAAREAAMTLAENIEKPAAIGPAGTTVRTNLEKTRALVSEWEAAGHDLQLTPAQASGSRAQALRELRLRQNPATMDEAQALEAKQLENAAKMADMYIGKIAKNPEMLGDERVAQNAAKAVGNYAETLLANRSAVARPLYEAAEKAGGGVDYAPVRAAFQKEIQDYNLKPNEMTGLIGSLYGKLEKTGAGGGLAMGELNAVRSKLLAVIRGKESLLGSAVPRSVETGIAGRLLGSIDDAMDGAASTSSGPAAQLWRRANEAWRKGTEAYENAMTDTVKSLLTKAAGDSAESIPARLLAAEPSQVRSVFAVLAKESPADAANLRAQMFEELMVRAGKPSATTSPTSAAEGLDRVQPGTVLRLLSAKGNAPQLEAAFVGDKQAQLGLRRMVQLFQRVGFGPNIKGSTTQPQIADAFADLGGNALDKLASGNGYTAAALQLLRKNVELITGNAKVGAQVISTPEGIAATNRALGLILDGKTGRPVTETAVRSAVSAMSNLGVSGLEALFPGGDSNEQPATPAQMQPQVVANQGHQQ